MTSCHPKGKAGWAQPDLRPDGDLTHGARAVKLGGTRAPRAWEEPDFSVEADAQRHQCPCSDRRPDGRRKNEMKDRQPRQEAQPALFYDFSLEDHVPQNHLLRSIDRFVDLSGIRSYLADFYSHTGRPSVDPELLIRMLLVGYCFGIRSERRLCEEVHLNLAYRWFCHLDLSDRVPDHSTFSKNRHGRFRDSELLRHLFETTVARCIEEGLVSGQRMAVDASLIEADANK